MAKDTLKKNAARNSQPPPSAPVPGNEGAYGNPPVTAADEVGLTKTERLNPIGSGILSGPVSRSRSQLPRQTVPVNPGRNNVRGQGRRCEEKYRNSDG